MKSWTPHAFICIPHTTTIYILKPPLIQGRRWNAGGKSLLPPNSCQESLSCSSTAACSITEILVFISVPQTHNNRFFIFMCESSTWWGNCFIYALVLMISLRHRNISDEVKLPAQRPSESHKPEACTHLKMAFYCCWCHFMFTSCSFHIHFIFISCSFHIQLFGSKKAFRLFIFQHKISATIKVIIFYSFHFLCSF